MAYADIVMPVGSEPREAGRIAVAAGLAQRMAARLHGVFLAPRPGGGRQTEDGLAPRPCEVLAADAARTSFFAAASRAGAVADWAGDGDGHDGWLASARQADLIIAPEDALTPAARAGTEPGWLAATCARPVLVLPLDPDETDIGRRILIAWDDSPQAWSALHAALPLLQRAEAIWVISTAPNPRAFTRSDRDLEIYLGDMGLVPMMVRRCTLSAARAILDEAARCGADLTVMGASAWRQMADAPRSGPNRLALRRPVSAALIVS